MWCFVASGGLGFSEQLKCTNVLSIYDVLLGLWGITTFVVVVGVGIYWRCKDTKKNQYCSCVWCVFLSVFIVFGGCFLLYSAGMALFTLATSVVVYGSYDSYANPTVNQTSQCSLPIFYFSFVSITLLYTFMVILTIASASFYFYTKILHPSS